MIKIKNARELDAMRKSNRIAAEVRDELARYIKPGMTTEELDRYAAERVSARNAICAFKGYRGYPGHICVSINDEVVHGIPGPRVICVGDIVSVDVGVIFEGFVGDTALTVPVGVTDPDVLRLLDKTREALFAGIGMAVAGNRLSDISHAIEQTAVEAGLSVVREFVGHGIGRDMHEDPQIPNFGAPGKGPKLKPGMTLSIEPMINLGGPDVQVQADRWTVRTEDGQSSAHFEHTVAVGRDRAEILTQTDGE